MRLQPSAKACLRAGLPFYCDSGTQLRAFQDVCSRQYLSSEEFLQLVRCTPRQTSPTSPQVLNMSNELASPVTAGRRAEDTALLIIELLGQGLDSEAGSTALSRMNYLHSRYGKLITRDDLLYTLSLFVFEPIDFIADYEWRPLSPLEAHARYVFWREVGARMGISDIPRTMADFRQWKEEYHKIATVYDPENVKTADATVDVLLGPLPKFARPFGQQASIVLLDDRVRTAFGWQRASPSLLYWLVPATLRLRALVVRYLLYPRTEPPAFLQSSPSTDGKTFVRKGFVFQPWYVSAGASRFGAVGYGKPGGARWKSEGFQHVSLGPERLSEVGLDKTLQDAQTLRERAGVCPFFM